MTAYAKLPAGVTLDVVPFRAHVEEEKLQHFKSLLKLSPVAPAVFENSHAGRRYGMEREWLEHAKSVWLNDFDWRKHEIRINSFPNFKASVKDAAGNTIEMQFLALFSEKTDAVPIVFLHGWPCSICDFLDILDILRGRYSPSDLPYHVIVPSLPGYAYSSGPPVDADYGVGIAAGAINNLMVGLGFGDGYLAQGGDLGSFICRILALNYDGCKGIHVNMMAAKPPPNLEEASLDEEEKRALQRLKNVLDTGLAFVLEQGTRAATVGCVLSASPLALLAWVGEKRLEGSESDLPLDRILEGVTLYWFTDTMSRFFYHNREMGDPNENPKIASISMVANAKPLELPYVEKPTGYSLFAHEIFPVPKSWAVNSCNLVSFNKHDHGGHFAAMEKPAELLADLEEYVKKVWKVTN